MSSTASCRIRRCRSSPVTRSSGEVARERREPLPEGARVGVPWLGWTCGLVAYCRAGRREPVRAGALHRAITRDGGYAEFTVADERFCFPIPDGLSDVQAAPLLCAGLIGHRALPAWRVALGASASTASVRRRTCSRRSPWPMDGEVFAFTRGGDAAAQAHARALGANGPATRRAAHPSRSTPRSSSRRWASSSRSRFGHVRKGGTIVCAGIHMSDIPSFPYEPLWGERVVRSVANLTRATVRRSCSWHLTSRCAPRSRRSRSSRRTKHLRVSEPAPSAAPSRSSPEPPAPRAGTPTARCGLS